MTSARFAVPSEPVASSEETTSAPGSSWMRARSAEASKTVTRTLSRSQAERYRTYFDNTKRLKELIKELEELSAHAVEEAEGWSPK